MTTKAKFTPILMLEKKLDQHDPWARTRYARIEIKLVHRENNEYRYFGDYDAPNTQGNLHLSDLRITAQMDNGATRANRSYGWELAYKPYTVNLRDVELMSKTLKAIERKLKGYYEKFGYPQTFGAYVAYVMQALGAKELVTDETEGRRSWFGVNIPWSVDQKVNEMLDILHPARVKQDA